MNTANDVSEEEMPEKDTEKVYRVGRREQGKKRIINVTFHNANMMEEVMRNARIIT